MSYFSKYPCLLPVHQPRNVNPDSHIIFLLHEYPSFLSSLLPTSYLCFQTMGRSIVTDFFLLASQPPNPYPSIFFFSHTALSSPSKTWSWSNYFICQLYPNKAKTLKNRERLEVGDWTWNSGTCPWLGIKSETIGSAGPCSSHWTKLARVVFNVFDFRIKAILFRIHCTCILYQSWYPYRILITECFTASGLQTIHFSARSCVFTLKLVVI